MLIHIFFLYIVCFFHTALPMDNIFSQDHHQLINKEKYQGPYKHTLKINIDNNDAGFFSWFKSVIGCLEYFEQHKDIFTNININLNGGPYHDHSRGSNWWEQYFKPITINQTPSTAQTNNSIMTSTITNLEYLKNLGFYACNENFSRERAFYLISKYIKIHTPIQEYIDSIIEHEFKNHFVVGIHYRGTDKMYEAREISYQDIYDTIEEEIHTHSTQPYKIFIATDDQLFLNDIAAKFNSTFALPMHRSTNENPVHLGAQPVSPYQRGLEALLDCVLLSQCNVLIIKTQSNLSSSASDFNPNVPIIMLNNPRPGLR